MIDKQPDAMDAAGNDKSSGMLLAQGVQCGKYSLAFSFDWARQIIDEFELVPVPRAPGWVLGAVNINGLIVPVIDVDCYFSASDAPSQLQRGQRLLLGGVLAEDAENALAIVFSQRPAQLEYHAEQITDTAALPQRLLEVCKGIAVAEHGKPFTEIDPQKLMAALAAELSII